jgi:hypothetical protein
LPEPRANNGEQFEALEKEANPPTGTIPQCFGWDHIPPGNGAQMDSSRDLGRNPPETKRHDMAESGPLLTQSRPRNVGPIQHDKGLLALKQYVIFISIDFCL